MGATATIVRSWIALRRALGIRHVRFRQDAVAFKVRATSASEYVAARTAYGERDLIASTALALAPDAVFYDIGANVGLYSLAASRRAAKVIAFEPAPANLEALEHNVAVNGARNVRVLGLAIGERDGEMELFLGERGAGSQINSLSPQVVHDFAHAEGRSARVRCARLDSIIRSEKLPAPTFVKIDVEGAEGAVLRGAFETLRAHRPLLQVELHPGAMERFGDDADGLVKLLDGLGYDSTVHPMRACLKLSAIPRAPPVARSP